MELTIMEVTVSSEQRAVGRVDRLKNLFSSNPDVNVRFVVPPTDK